MVRLITAGVITPAHAYLREALRRPDAIRFIHYFNMAAFYATTAETRIELISGTPAETGRNAMVWCFFVDGRNSVVAVVDLGR